MESNRARMMGAAQQRQKAILLSENGLSDIWLPFVDSFRSQLHGGSKEIFATLATIAEVLSVLHA